jgi:hypothetical protein
MIFLLVTIFPALLGIYLMIDFASWEVQGSKTVGKIAGFSDKKDKGKVLPIVSLIGAEGEITVTPSRIDQFAYLAGTPQAGNAVDIIYKKANDVIQARIYGYLNAVGGFLMIIPFIISLGLWVGNGLMATQGAFFLVLAGIIAAAMVAMKMIQRVY